MHEPSFDELTNDIAHDLLFGLWLSDRHLRHGLVDLNEGIDLRNMQVTLEAIHPRHARVDLRDNVLCRANAFRAATNMTDIAVAMLVGSVIAMNATSIPSFSTRFFVR